LADAESRQDEPGGRVEEGMNLGKVSKIGKNSLEKCQKDMLFILDNVKIIIFAN